MPATRNNRYLGSSLPQQTNQHNTWSRHAIYDSLGESRSYANRLLPGCDLDYIPKRERDHRNWIGEKEYLDPKRGSLTWCHAGAPRTRSALNRTKMFIIDGLVGANVDAVARAAKVQRMKRLNRGTPYNPFWVPLEQVKGEDMYEALLGGDVSREDFMRWLDIKDIPSLIPLDELEKSMGRMSVSPTPTRVGELEEVENFVEWDKVYDKKGMEKALNEAHVTSPFT